MATGLLVLFTIVVVLSGCQALSAAAPMLLDGVDRAIAAEIDRARAGDDKRRETDLAEAKVALEETRAAVVAAEAAAREATKAAIAAQEAWERGWREQERLQRAREERARRRLRTKLERLRMLKPVPADVDSGVQPN